MSGEICQKILPSSTEFQSSASETRFFNRHNLRILQPPEHGKLVKLVSKNLAHLLPHLSCSRKVSKTSSHNLIGIFSVTLFLDFYNICRCKSWITYVRSTAFSEQQIFFSLFRNWNRKCRPPPIFLMSQANIDLSSLNSLQMANPSPSLSSVNIFPILLHPNLIWSRRGMCNFNSNRKQDYKLWRR